MSNPDDINPDTDVRALYLYLKSLQAQPHG